MYGTFQDVLGYIVVVTSRQPVAFETITGYTQAETIGKNCRFLQGNDRDQQERHQLREAVLNKQSIEITLRNYRKNGEMFYNHLVITPLFDSKGNVLYYLGVQFDVTQQKKAEEEIKRLTEQLAKLSK